MVSTYLGLLAKTHAGKLDKDANDYIEVATNGARRMKALVEDLLVFSQTGREDLKFEPTDCSSPNRPIVQVSSLEF